MTIELKERKSNFFNRWFSKLNLNRTIELESSAMQKGLILGAVPEIVDLQTEGYSKAKENDGNINALKLHLSQIIEGRFVEKNSKIALNEEEKKKCQQEITRLTQSIQKFENEQKNIEEKIIPEHESEITKAEKEIEEITTNRNPIYLLGRTFSRAKAVTISIFLILLWAYLYFFYVSAIDSAFFRNIEAELKNLEGGTESLSILLNSIFNPNVIYDAGNELLIILLAPWLFFGLAFSVHLLLENINIYKKIGIALIIIVTFLSDALVAYKIDKSINDITSIIKLIDTGWVWYKSINFYIVLVMGFLGLIIWSIILNAFLNEIEKLNISKLKRIEIDNRKRNIGKHKSKVDLLNHRTADLLTFTKNHNEEIQYCHKLIDSSFIPIETIEVSLDSFGAGWIKFITQKPNSKLESSECELTIAMMKKDFLKKQQNEKL